MKRRRFLAIAAAIVLPGQAGASPAIWRGRAFGGEASITLRGGRRAEAALQGVIADIRRIERRFSLFDPASDICRLNRSGAIEMDAEWRSMLAEIDRLHRITDGVFDPTVQPLWALMAKTGGAPEQADWAAAKSRMGWGRVMQDGETLRLQPGQALTLNGIAQGFGCDLIRDRLHHAGFYEVLVDLGVFRAGRDGSWQIGIDGLPDRVRLRGGALALSEPGAMRFGDGGPAGHIFDARGRYPRPAPWNLVAVHAASAARADGLSTSFALMEEAAIRRAVAETCHGAVLVAGDGRVLRLGRPSAPDPLISVV
ncbi:MAG: FAD:protein FMN transferase [Paracoccus sp. (in: a-proteobacteria)]